MLKDTEYKWSTFSVIVMATKLKLVYNLLSHFTLPVCLSNLVVQTNSLDSDFNILP